MSDIDEAVRNEHHSEVLGSSGGDIMGECRPSVVIALHDSGGR